MKPYKVLLEGLGVQEAVVYTGDNRLGEVGRWAAQYQKGSIFLQIGLDTTTRRLLSMDDIVANPETTLREWFGGQVPE